MRDYMICVGVTNSVLKEDGTTPYCWIYYLQENHFVDGFDVDKCYLKFKNIDIKKGDKFKWVFKKGNDGKYYRNDVEIIGHCNIDDENNN